MAEPAGIPSRRVNPGEVVHLDVDFCDLVPPSGGETDPALRFKGREVDGQNRLGALVRVFVDGAESAAVTMRKTGVLRGALPVLPAGETTLPVPLACKRITLRRVQGPRSITWLDIRPREGVITAEDEEILADYHWAFAHARNQFVPLLHSDGYPVGATELLTIADTLVRARRQRRHTRG